MILSFLQGLVNTLVLVFIVIKTVKRLRQNKQQHDGYIPLEDCLREFCIIFLCRVVSPDHVIVVFLLLKISYKRKPLSMLIFDALPVEKFNPVLRVCATVLSFLNFHIFDTIFPLVCAHLSERRREALKKRFEARHSEISKKQRDGRIESLKQGMGFYKPTKISKRHSVGYYPNIDVHQREMYNVHQEANDHYHDRS
eukprot:TRINITY_DN781855_c0_g1_i1.p1 TRINITY_DN781855_c0_g1~~TRINITY_DN781855_c0_g1_i1.p1  ORF type:complete len:197 (-),score=17.06 TRINITY_DN781855_c0_g1_i1:127-717(-)